MQVVLVMFRADGERRSFSVTRDVTVIGRREDCDLRIPLGDVSRKHCRIIRDSDTLRVEDLGSSNGTFHNGIPVQEVTLSPGDTLQVGPVVFCVQMDGVPSEEDMTPLTAQAGAAYDESGEMPNVSATGGMHEVGDEEAIEEAAVEPLAGDEQADVDLTLETEETGSVSDLMLEPASASQAGLSDSQLNSHEPTLLEEDIATNESNEPAAAGNNPVAAEEEIVLGDFDIVAEDEAQASQSGDVIDGDVPADSKH